jgi:hypothetical protein
MSAFICIKINEIKLNEASGGWNLSCILWSIRLYECIYLYTVHLFFVLEWTIRG